MLMHALLALGVCTGAPSSAELARHIAARAQQDAAASFTTTYRKVFTEEEEVESDRTPNPAKPISEEERVWRNIERKLWHVAGNGARYQQSLYEHNDASVSRAKPEQKIVDARSKFLARYTLTVASPCMAQLAGRPHWVVAFTPRTDIELPEEDREDALLNHVAGTMYIDARSWFIRHATGALTESFSVMLFGRVSQAQLLMEQDEDDGVVLLRTTVVTLRRRTLFGQPKHRRLIYQFLRTSETVPRLTSLIE